MPTKLYTPTKTPTSEKGAKYFTLNSLQKPMEIRPDRIAIQCVISGRQGSGKSQVKADLQHAILKHARQWSRSVGLTFWEVGTDKPDAPNVMLMLERMIEVIQANTDLKKLDSEDKQAVADVKKFLKCVE